MNFKRTATLLSALSVFALMSCNNGKVLPGKKISKEQAAEFVTNNFYTREEGMDHPKTPNSVKVNWDFSRTTNEIAIAQVKNVIIPSTLLQTEPVDSLKGNKTNTNCNETVPIAKEDALSIYVENSTEFALLDDTYISFRISVEKTMSGVVTLNKQGYLCSGDEDLNMTIGMPGSDATAIGNIKVEYTW